MLFYPVEVLQTVFTAKVEGEVAEKSVEWIEEGTVAGPLSDALSVLDWIISYHYGTFNEETSPLNHRLGQPKEGVGIAEDWMCPNCGHDHIIKWQWGRELYSCPECLMHKEEFTRC